MESPSNESNNKELLSLFSNLKLEYNNNPVIVNNESELLKYIHQIDKLGTTFEQKYKFKYLNGESIEEKNEKKFFHLFSKKDKYHESFNSNIKSTYTNDHNIKTIYNNVFILNSAIDENQEFCFEIKLGHGNWDDPLNINNNLKIGLIELNKENIKEISEYISINQNNKLEFNKNIRNFEGANLFSEYDNNNEISKKFEEYKKAIFFSININNFQVPITNKIENNYMNYRLIQKNDIIGIVYNNKAFNDFIQMKIYINGEIMNTQLINKPEKNLKNNNKVFDDDFEIEKNNKNYKQNQIYTLFIELGDNKTIFIKDKSTKNPELWNKIKFNEKIEYIDKYQSSPLNYFNEEIFDLENITRAYFDILNKVATKIFKHKKGDINKYFKQLINFFKTFSFNNRIVIEKCVLDFLLSGIDIDKGDIIHFKENVETLVNIINEVEKYNDSGKIKLLEKIICFIIEIVMENNTNILDYYNIEKNKQGEIENFKKCKFILCFLLFDQYFLQGDQIISNLLSKVSLFKSKNNIFNFCYSIFNSRLYFSPINAIEFITQFYTNNNFDKNRFLDFNFRKFINDKYYNNLLEDNQHMMRIIIKEIDMNKKEKTIDLIKFITSFCFSDDHISIINLVIIQLIKYYFLNSNNIDKTKVEKIIYTNYITANRFNQNSQENTFYGKNEAFQKHLNLSNIYINEDEKKEALIFDLIVRCISNFYKVFSYKEQIANDTLEFLSNPKNNITDIEIYKINYMIEFYQSFFFGNFYLHLGYFTNYLLKFLLNCIKEKYLDVVPYFHFLQNILFILDMLKIRCSFIEKNNLIDKSEISIIYSNIDKILKYVFSFFGEIVPRLRNTNFSPVDHFENIISINITILIKVMSFDKNIIKDSFSSVKDNLVLTFKNLAELYDKNKYKKIYSDINSLIKFLYEAGIKDYNNNNSINISSRTIFFKEVMAHEIEEFKKQSKEDTLAKNNYIEQTMYYNIFIIIYKRIKIIRESLIKIFENNFLFDNNSFYQKEYLIKFTQVIKIFFNFLCDSNLGLFYDTSTTCFFKINSFICKTYKMLSNDNILKKIQNIYQEDDSIVLDFFSAFLHLSSLLLISKDQNSYEYYYQMAQNRKGFYFEIFKINFEKYFGYPKCKTMIEFLDILLNNFRKLCDDKDVLKLEDVNDNSIDLDKRESCPICLEFIDEKDVHINPCNHMIHKKCLQEMLDKMKKKQCPFCKRIILGIKEDPSFIVTGSNNSYNSSSSLFEERNPFRPSGNLFLFGSDNSSNDSQRNDSQRPRLGLFETNNRGLFSGDNGINNININSGIAGGLFSDYRNNNGNLFSFSRNSLFD